MGSPPPIPALFTSTSSEPPRSRSAATARPTDAGTVTSIASAIASPPRSRISAAVRSISAAVRAATATVAPRPANASAIARPIPRPPPVTSMSE